jgi:acyl-CoA thioester hydrolase
MKYKFYYPLRVRYVETDAQRHVFFGHYLTYFDVGLTEYMRAIGCHYPDMVASGVDMFYVEAGCQYKGRARFDDLLHVHTRIGHIGNTSFTFEFAIYKQPTDELIATGTITAVAVDVEGEALKHDIDEILQMGVNLQLNTHKASVDELFEDFDTPMATQSALAMEKCLLPTCCSTEYPF